MIGVPSGVAPSMNVYDTFTGEPQVFMKAREEGWVRLPCTLPSHCNWLLQCWAADNARDGALAHEGEGSRNTKRGEGRYRAYQQAPLA